NTGPQTSFFQAGGAMRSIWMAFGVGGLTWASLGCNAPAEKLVPVAGKVTLGGKPWTIGDVGFFPDASRGNPIGRASIGVIRRAANHDGHTVPLRARTLQAIQGGAMAHPTPNSGGKPVGSKRQPQAHPLADRPQVNQPRLNPPEKGSRRTTAAGPLRPGISPV